MIEDIGRLRELTPEEHEKLHTDQFRNLVNPNRNLHVRPEDYDVYCESLSKEMYAENMILVQIGQTLLPMLLGMIDPKKYKDAFVHINMVTHEKMDDLDPYFNQKTYISIIENFIPILRNMVWQRETHERVLHEMAQNLSEKENLKKKYNDLLNKFEKLKKELKIV
jgi:hypothetical protein